MTRMFALLLSTIGLSLAGRAPGPRCGGLPHGRAFSHPVPAGARLWG